METKQIYNEEFKDLIRKISSYFYIGKGNPNGNILIIGKECAININDTEGKNQYKREIDNNLCDWKNNINKEITKDNIDNWVDSGIQSPKFNPLYPYKGAQFSRSNENGTSETWYNYQKLYSMISGKNIEKFDSLNFLDECFISELSTATGVNSSSVNEDERTLSIKVRKQLLKHDFFKNFPIVIVAAGHYPRDFDVNLEEIFKVKYLSQIKVGSNWINIHYSEDKSRILIHTRQLSNSFPGELLIQIANKCREFYK